MLNESDFQRFYQQAKQVLDKYSCQKEVKKFLTSTFAELEQVQSLSSLNNALTLFCKQLKTKVNSIGLTAFGGTNTACGCLKKLKAINEEITSLLNPKPKRAKGLIKARLRKSKAG
ncbi:hypothetical protein [Candidatus Berkiella aquae]|uniref:Uncharacterized protein n=1 Tax=Candidatus Berkiella aquae TaxID=295108 RepID=A0A0Q9Z0M8_9GAMM|nr:hypothetical protein [Candidatus Berkiella aquae]MCS5712058.1 hypothetical protein [Candidatus Berkiella aquae]